VPTCPTKSLIVSPSFTGKPLLSVDAHLILLLLPAKPAISPFSILPIPVPFIALPFAAKYFGPISA
jgi:hypothetical protein